MNTWFMMAKFSPINLIQKSFRPDTDPAVFGKQYRQAITPNQEETKVENSRIKNLNPTFCTEAITPAQSVARMKKPNPTITKIVNATFR